MLNRETMVTLDEAVSRLPVRRNRSALWRWCRVGINGVKLEHGFAGATILTSMEAIDRFFQALAQTKAGAERQAARHPAPRRRTTRASNVAGAEASLAQLGIN